MTFRHLFVCATEVRLGGQFWKGQMITFQLLADEYIRWEITICQLYLQTLQFMEHCKLCQPYWPAGLRNSKTIQIRQRTRKRLRVFSALLTLLALLDYIWKTVIRHCLQIKTSCLTLWLTLVRRWLGCIKGALLCIKDGLFARVLVIDCPKKHCHYAIRPAQIRYLFISWLTERINFFLSIWSQCSFAICHSLKGEIVESNILSSSNECLLSSGWMRDHWVDADWPDLPVSLDAPGIWADEDPMEGSQSRSLGKKRASLWQEGLSGVLECKIAGVEGLQQKAIISNQQTIPARL